MFMCDKAFLLPKTRLSYKAWDHNLPLSCCNLLVYALDTTLNESMYLSMHMAMHLLSEFPIEEPGLVIHFLKHLSVTFCRSSCMLARSVSLVRAPQWETRTISA